ncbi:MAG TPA: protein kinase [Pyrinomonadaceae bacterium]|jgi:serine/threonine protein kinase
MTIAAGTRLGRYEIRSKIGEGGMGEVYLARDTQLGRDVAVKVLPSTYSDDAERLHRFEQEACAASALNHPNILSIYDVGTHESSPYIVSELLEGQTLRHRLSGTTLPQRKTIDYALQIAHGLAAAHERGIVHRDLKPDNLFITNDGRVKILDFGLAKLTGAGDTALSQTSIPTRRVDTDPGKVMGTVGYMSPEQVKGRPVDHRSDIFSFGTILYEMLSGRRAFHGESAAETMSAILKEDPPDLSETNQRIFPALERLVNHCLEKNPESRFHSASDLAFALEALSGSTGASTQTVTMPALAPQWIRRHALTGWIVAAVAVLLAIIVFASTYFRRAPTTEDVATRFYVSPPETALLSGADDFISPDGRRIVFSAIGKDGKRQLWIRSLDSLDAQVLPGTEEGIQAFWSPDSRYLGFFTGSKLKKIEVSGGPATTLADATAVRGGAWSREGVIIFGASTSGPLYRIPSAGGQPTVVTALDTTRNQTVHSWPHFLPDGRHFVYLGRSALREKSAIYVGSIDASESKFLINADSTPAYAPPGYLLFLRERTLMAEPFDADKLQLTGDPFPIAEQVGFNAGNGRGFFSASDNGVLVYRSRVFGDAQLVWFDRTGKEIGRIGTPGQISSLALSPDDKRVVASRVDNQSGTTDLWMIDQQRETRFTFDPASDASPVWSPDGSQIAFNSSRAGTIDLYVKPSNGAGNEELLLKSANIKGPHSWSPDGRFVLYGEVDPKTNTDLWVLPLFGDRKPFPFLQTPFIEFQSRFSPNGKWVAYASNELGVNQIYVRPFPPSAGQWMVSTNGGSQPRWSGNGKELFYLGLDRKLMVVEVNEDGNNFTAGTPKPLLDTRIATISFIASSTYDVTRDGQRFLVITAVEESSPSPLTVVLNWTAGLKK